MMKPDIVAVILAGGLSKRMGMNKPLMKVANRPLIEHVIERLKPQCDRIAINANDALDAYVSYDLPVISDVKTGYLGPLAGIHSAVRWAKKMGASHVATIATDTPLFPSDFIARCCQEIGEHDLAMAVTDARDGHKYQPAFGLWPVELEASLETALNAGIRKILAFTDQYDMAEIYFPSKAGDDPFFNLNRPEDVDIAAPKLKK